MLNKCLSLCGNFFPHWVRGFGSFQRVWRGRHTAFSLATLTELYKMFQHHLICKGSFSKRNYHQFVHIYPSVTGSFTFFLVPFGCNLTAENTPLPKPEKKQKSDDSKFLPPSYQNRVPTCILNSKVNWNLMFFWETNSISVRKRSLKSYYQPTIHLEKFYGNKTAIPKKTT